MTRSTFLATVWLAAVGVFAAADEPKSADPKKPQWQRVLTGDDAKRAEKLQKRMGEPPATDDYADALKAGEELLALRTRVQGDDHHETASAKHEVAALRKVAELPAEKRKEWRAASAGTVEAGELEGKGKHAEALPRRQAYSKSCVEVLGEEHPFTAAGYYRTAVNLNAQNKPADALALHRKALDIRRKAFGEEHPTTAMSYYAVAFTLNKQSKHAEALKLHQKALDIRLKVLGEEHPDTAFGYNEVGYTLNSQDKPAEALPIHQKALAIRLKVLGEMHAHTALSYFNVAHTLGRLGKYTEAQPLYQKALDIRLKVLGEGHASTALSYNDAGYNLDRQGKPAEAQAFYQKALDIRLKLFGEEHATTAVSYSNVAYSLDRQGKHAEAQPLFRKALDVTRKVRGEAHADTGDCYAGVAFNLARQGKHTEAMPLFQKALDIGHKARGDGHPANAPLYNNLAYSLGEQGKHAEAQPLHQKVLDISRLMFGREHPDTITAYNNLAYNLDRLGKHAEAQPLFQWGLDANRRVLGEWHVATALSYNNLATNLAFQGKYAEAESLFRKALDINRRALGEDNPATALNYNNVAYSLGEQDRHADARPLYEKALEIHRKALGEEHPTTALSRDNLATNLARQGKHAEAAPFYRKALDTYRAVLGEDNPATALSTYNTASNLALLGKHAEAQPLFQKALDVNRKVLGEEHPTTAHSYGGLAVNLCEQGKYAEAEAVLKRGVYSYESSRLARAVGVDRASLGNFNPRLLLAAIQQSREPNAAWREVELSLARGLLDQQAERKTAALTAAEQAEQTRHRDRVAALRPQILALVAKGKLADAEAATLNALLKERREAEERLAALAVAVSQRAVAEPDAILGALPADAALVFWVDLRSPSETVQEHWACVVRPGVGPKWARLPGTGPGRKWEAADSRLPDRFRKALALPAPKAEIDALAEQLRAQRIAPVAAHLEGVKALYVVPVNDMAGVPVELLAPDRVVSYVPSGTFLVRSKSRPPLTGRRALALGDPIFTRDDQKPAAPRPLPAGGLLITQVIPDGAAAKARLKAGDVLLKYGDAVLTDVDSLKAAITANEKAASIPATVWRESEDNPVVRDVAPGKMGVVLDPDPAPVALANRRKADALVGALRGAALKDLPGTRVETDRLKQMLGDQCEVLTDGAASEPRLEALRKSGDLAKFRYLHLATHAQGNSVSAFESALILSQNRLTGGSLPKAGEPYVDGRLSAAEVLEFWTLDAELVTLSACETAVGKPGSGDGSLGFAQAFLTAGSRSVCLSLWEVDDAATALLMDRFYHNLLGQRDGLAKPMGKAAALDEAKRWLRNLSGEEALALTAKLTKGVARGPRGKDEVLKLVVPSADTKAPPTKGSRPFAHPQYWAAFVLIGDPD